MPLLIRGGTVVNHDHSRRADVLVDGDTIVAVGASIDAPAGTEMIDAGGSFVMPGGIDPHTHLEMPFMGTVTADDFESGTKAALTGGTTMVVDFCLPDPGQSMLAAYQEWRHKSEKAASRLSPGAGRQKSTVIVVPPARAAMVPLSKSSAVVVPMNGMSMWVCGSMPPGIT